MELKSGTAAEINSDPKTSENFEAYDGRGE
jgi:hypothetical protein